MSKGKPPKLVEIVVAMDRNNGIGKNNTLPWRLAADLKHFRMLTSYTMQSGHKNLVIMGRKTWDSLPDKMRPLPDRVNAVVTRTKHQQLAGARTFECLEDAIAFGQGVHFIERIFVIGGAEIYKLALSLADRIHVTNIDAEFDCDAHFPEIDRDKFEMLWRGDTQRLPGVGFDFNFAILHKPFQLPSL